MRRSGYSQQKAEEKVPKRKCSNYKSNVGAFNQIRKYNIAEY